MVARRWRSGPSTSSRSPAACRATSSGSCGSATAPTPSRRPSRRSRSASTGCCATSSGCGLPAVVPQGVVTGRVDADGEELPAALLTEHLQLLAALPQPVRPRAAAPTTCRRSSTRWWCCSCGCTSRDFYWGDVSLSNVLFRRSAGRLRGVPRRRRDRRAPGQPVGARCASTTCTVGSRERLRRAARPAGQRVARPRGRGARHRRAARRALPRAVGRADRGGGVLPRRDVADRAADRAAQRPRLRRRRARHRHRLRRRQGADPAQGRSSSATTSASSRRSPGCTSRTPRRGGCSTTSRRTPPTSTSAARTAAWSRTAGSTEIYEPIMAMIPPEARGKLEPAEIFHEILVHRWYLSERAGHEVDHLRHRPRLHRQRPEGRSPTSWSPPPPARPRTPPRSAWSRTTTWTCRPSAAPPLR